jgi:formate dehydrogenase maturation protein FdhE
VTRRTDMVEHSSYDVAVRESWDRRIRRAEQLAAEAGPAASLLAFYARLLRQQKVIYESLQDRAITGAVEQEAAFLTRAGAAVLREVAVHGSAPLVAEAHTLLERDGSALAALLVAYWQERSDRQFFAKAILQPYAQRCAEAGVITRGDSLSGGRCPRCGGAPQVSILEAATPESLEGGSRELLCATCLTAWPFRRVLCPACGEEDERKLGYFQSPALEHVRVDACETCRRYLKTVDRGRFGLALPLVDEIAGASLDIWAQEHGYTKIELNLVGL